MEATCIGLVGIMLPLICWTVYKVGGIESTVKRLDQKVNKYINGSGGKHESNNSGNQEGH